MLLQSSSPQYKQVEQALTNTDLCAKQIADRLGVHRNTVRSIGCRLLGTDNYELLEQKKQAALCDKIITMREDGLPIETVAQNLGIPTTFLNYLQTKFKRKQRSAQTGTHDEADDNSMVRVISIAGTPAAAPEHSSSPKLPQPADKAETGDKPSAPALEQSVHPAALLPVPAVIPDENLPPAAQQQDVSCLKTGSLNLSFNLNRLTRQGTENLCALIETLSKLETKA